MMKCGHAANAIHHRHDGTDAPCCVICFNLDPGATIVEENPPSLEGRTAVCTGCKNRPQSQQPSAWTLPFFEYCGEGSRTSKLCKHCGFTADGHPSQGGTGNYSKSDKPIRGLCEHRGLLYEPRGDTGTDKFYCGCWGWD